MARSTWCGVPVKRIARSRYTRWRSGRAASGIGIPYRGAGGGKEERRRATESTPTPARIARTGRRRMKYWFRKYSPADVASSAAPAKRVTKRARARVSRAQKNAENPKAESATARYEVGRISPSALPRFISPCANGVKVAYVWA